jgi:hypothetical protein
MGRLITRSRDLGVAFITSDWVSWQEPSSRQPWRRSSGPGFSPEAGYFVTTSTASQNSSTFAQQIDEIDPPSD